MVVDDHFLKHGHKATFIIIHNFVIKFKILYKQRLSQAKKSNCTDLPIIGDRAAYATADLPEFRQLQPLCDKL